MKVFYFHEITVLKKIILYYLPVKDQVHHLTEHSLYITDTLFYSKEFTKQKRKTI